jgi:hypothetical protein
MDDYIIPAVRGRRQHIYWYLLFNKNGGDYLVKTPCATEDEANAFGMRKLSCCFEVRSFPTPNLAAATQMLKGGKFASDNYSVDDSIQKVKHGL